MPQCTQWWTSLQQTSDAIRRAIGITTTSVLSNGNQFIDKTRNKKNAYQQSLCLRTRSRIRRRLTRIPRILLISLFLLALLRLVRFRGFTTVGILGDDEFMSIWADKATYSECSTLVRFSWLNSYKLESFQPANWLRNLRTSESGRVVGGGHLEDIWSFTVHSASW